MARAALFSVPEYRTYRDEAQTLSGLMAYSRHWTVTLGRESPQPIEGILVTCNYFDVLGLTPALGAGFTPGQLRRSRQSACGRPEPCACGRRIRRRPVHPAEADRPQRS